MPKPTRTCQHSGAHRSLLALAALAVLPGCAIVSSQAPGAQQSPQGLLYHLPKALLPVELVARGDTLELRVLQPRLVADPAQRYLLTHPVSPLSSDTVKVEFDDSGLLLSKLTMDSSEQSLDVLKAIASSRAIRRTEGASGDEQVLASGDFDPDDSGTANQPLRADLQEALRRQVARWTQQCLDKPESAERCSLAGRLAPLFAAGTAADATLIGLSVTAAGTASAEPTAGAAAAPGQGASEASANVAADCTVGLCYRSQRPFTLRLSIAGEFARSTVAMLPNGAPPIALALTRAPFVKTEYTVAFNGQGLPKSLEAKRPSSALALVSWTVDVYKAVLQATSELVQLRIDDNAKAKALAQSELETAKELQRLQDEMRDFLKQRTESAGASMPLLSIALGGRSSLLPPGSGAAAAAQGAAASGAAPAGPPTPCTAGQPCDAVAPGGAKP